MANAAYATDGTLGVNFFQVDTTPQFRLGQEVEGTSKSEWVYGYTPGGVTGQGYVVSFDPSYNATMVTTALMAGKRGTVCGVAANAMAAGTYGWFQRIGGQPQPTTAALPAGAFPTLQVAASTAAFTLMNTTAVPGQLGTDATAGSAQVTGVIIMTAQGSGGAGQQACTLSGTSIGPNN